MTQEDLLQNNQNNMTDGQHGEAVQEKDETKRKSVWPLVLGIIAVLLVSAVVLVILFPQVSQNAEDDSWERVKLEGVLRVATSADYPPFSYYNQDFEIDGFDPALIQEIGDKLGIQIEITDYAFESLNKVLQNDQADVSIAALSVSPERDAMMDFSNIYFIGRDGILARADSGLAPITNINQLTGLLVGVQRGTVYEKWAQDTLVDSNLITQEQLFSYVKLDQAVEDLKASRLNYVMMDRQPAIQYLSDPDLVLAGESLYQQRLAIALPTGAQELKSVINQALLDLQNEGRINQLAQEYLGLRPEDIIPPPTCLDSMTFIRDINMPDENLTSFTMINPGEAFQKGWQIKNTGTCIWNGATYIEYVRGNDPAAQMEGQPTKISGTVEPGQTYDLYVNLVAPLQAGKFVGYWQMHSAEGIPFGQTIWVAIEIPGTPPEPTEPTEPQPPTLTLTATEAPPEPIETEEPPEPTQTEEPTDEPGSDLLDITWVLESYRGDLEDEELTEPIEDSEVQLVFDDSGSLSGNAGCNIFRADYVTNGIEIEIGLLLNTRKFCQQPDGVMDQEVILLTLIEDVEEYRIVIDEQENELLEMVVKIIEDNIETEKVLLVFYDQLDGPPNER
ncbi:MAG: transporter substrate-binding domain-containing protein [Anaerolineales bacterium]